MLGRPGQKHKGGPGGDLGGRVRAGRADSLAKVRLR